MNFVVNGHNMFLIVLVTFLAAVILTPIAKKMAFHVGAVDHPDKNRKVHKKDMPSMGGIAIFGAFLLGYMLFAPKTDQMIAILIGAFIIIVTGIMDDVHPLSPLPKLAGQILAACIAVIYGGIVFNDMQIFGHVFRFGVFAYPISVLFIVAIINAINLADGLDGLAAGTSAIYFLTIAVIGFIMSTLGGLDVILCLIMLGACLGFLIYNFNPASIFMGDTGSMFLGFIISVIALLGFRTATITSLIIPILTLFVPIIDTILAMGRRIINGKKIGAADKDHLHHQLLKQTKSTKKAVLLMYLMNALFATVSIFYTLGDQKISMILYLILLLIFILIILKTNILFQHNEKGNKKWK